MSKVISYSLFKGNDPITEGFYVRGFYFNYLMNKLIYPDWKTCLHVDNHIGQKYYDLFIFLKDAIVVFEGGENETYCGQMLWRLLPAFWNDTGYILCRDADALTTYREAQAVSEWLASGLNVHSIHDNQAHNIPVMGGLCGFRGTPLRDKYGSFNSMISQAKRTIDKHGSDQHFLTDVIYRDFQNDMYLHNFKGQKHHCHTAVNGMNEDRTNKLWLSNLCIPYIGSAGCIEMETLRFLRDHSPEFNNHQELWKKYPKLFYWYD